MEHGRQGDGEADATSATRCLPGLLPDELEGWLARRGERAFRARQVLAWVHRRSVLDPSRMTDLPPPLRDALSSAYPEPPGRVVSVARSRDGTRRLTVAWRDGATVDTVLIPDGAKLTQCLSTQVGCAFRCLFCRSGVDGLVRNLTADEVLAQVHLAVAAREPGERLGNVVLMGSGEPLANYAECARALRILTSPLCLDLSTRRVTLSTLGLPRGIARLGRDFGGQIGLAVSLHAADDIVRQRLVPGAAGIPLARIVGALAAYPLPRRRRITVEYVLVRGVNDGVEQAAELGRLLSPLRVKVNLIPCNPHPRCDLAPPSDGAVESFQQELLSRGIATIVRKGRGLDIDAACGQLAAAALSRRPRA